MGGLFSTPKMNTGQVVDTDKKLKNISLYAPKNKKKPTYSDKIFTIDLSSMK